MNVTVINKTVALQMVRKLDPPLLHPNGRIKLHPASFYQQFSKEEILAWCNLRARYSIPTQELVTWLKEQIGDRRALEIGAGMGDLGYHLGIKTTDSYLQVNNAEVRAYYAKLGQPPTQPPKFVERREALAAVRKYRPQVVIGCYITQKWQLGDLQGSDYGVEEDKMLRLISTYIHVGNLQSHGDKRLLQLPHQVYQPPWLVSRSPNPASNLIYIWSNQP